MLKKARFSRGESQRESVAANRPFRRKRAARIVAAALCLLLLASLAGCSSAPAAKLRVYAFSAGAADAFLITTENAAVLIDCGQKACGRAIADYLAEQGIERLDLLIVTHFDKDHIGGAANVLRSVPVGRVLQSVFPRDSKAYESYLSALAEAGLRAETVTEPLALALDGAELLVDAPAGGYASNESNNSSLIVSLTYGRCRLLFMGDAEDERIAEFLASDAGSYDFLKVPHHGKGGKLTARLIDSVRPKIALITSSDSEKEDKRVVRALEEAGAEVYLTRKGRVVVECDGRSLTAQYETAS